ncbi:MAG: VCBS repeat-containing protein [Methanomassiliicoccales archaeon]|nr:VCBS repeat-containing protein [Methanomassiliicoccales archaeon]
MSRVFRKLRKAKEAVSEIIANILVLAITVTLFSSIMWYVGTMPAPTEQVYGDFDATLSFVNGGTSIIEIVHKSGPTLKDYRTDIYLIVDEVPHTLHIRDGTINGTNSEEWRIGDIWKFDATAHGISITPSSSVTIMIVDPTVNSLIWSTRLLGAEGRNPPVIMNKWVGIKIGSIWTATSTVLQTQQIKVFAKVTDVDGDLSAVYADLSCLGISDDMGFGVGIYKMIDSNGDGTFSTEMDIGVPVLNNTGERAINVIAEDTGGRRTISVLLVTIQSYTTGPPTILYAAIEPSSSILGSTFTVRCYITDPNDNLNKSSVVVANEDNYETLGTVNTSHLSPSTAEGVAAPGITKLRSDDGDFLSVPAGGYANVTAWSLPFPDDITGKTFQTAVLKVRYYTGNNFNGTNILLNVDGSGKGLPILRWTTPITRVFNLMAMGYDTVDELKNVRVTFHNEGNDTVYFDYWWLEVTYSNTTLTAFQRLVEDPYNPGYFTGYGVARSDILEAASRTYYYRISASDETGNEVSVRISHTVITSEILMGGGYGKGEPPGNLNYSALQGFNIFELSEWKVKNYSATPRTIFSQSEDAVVVVASKYLVNTDNENTLLVIDPTTKVVVSAVSSPNVVFQRYDYNSGYYVYNATIDCAKLQNNKKYMVQVQLRDTWVPNNIFFATQLITIGSADYPVFMTFKDSSYSIPCTEFTTYDLSNNIIYVEIRNRYGGDWFQYGGDVEIRDFFWNAQIKRVPPLSGWNGPVSTVTKVDTNVYRFAINLANATEGTPWIPGENAYVLRYDMFKAGNETYVLSKVITITAPKYKLDFVAGIDLQTSGPSWSQKYTMFFYKNDNHWSPPDMLEGVNEAKKPIYISILVRTGDMNNDGKNDIVAVVAEYNSSINKLETYWLFLYMNDGYWTRYTIADLGTSATPTVLELGNLDFDNDLDIILGFSNGKVCFYRNDGIWSYKAVDTSLTSSVADLKVGDLDWAFTPGNDPQRSLDIAVCRADGTVQIYKNSDGAGVTWTRYSRTGTATDVVDYADSDIHIFGIQTGQPTGTYLDTQNAYYDPGVFERIIEQWVYRYQESTPAARDAIKDTTNETDATQLRPNDNQYYTVIYGQTAYIKSWDPTGLIGDVPIDRLIFKVRYKTYRYDGTDYIKWGLGTGDPTNNMMQIRNSEGEWIEDEFNLTGSIQLASTLINLKVSFTNTYFLNEPSVIDFDYWILNVTWKTGDKLDHRWTIEVTPGTSHTFQLYASKSSAEDDFQFYYSTDNITFTAMTSAKVTSTSPTLYTFTLPAGISGKLYIKVEDTNRASTVTSLDYVDIYQMSVRTTAAGGLVGSTAKALAIADMNNDGSNDLIVVGESSKKGRLWVGLNNEGNILPYLVQVIPDNSDLAGCVGADAGFFVGGNSLKDIALATGSKVYFIEQTTLGTYAMSSLSFSISTITVMAAGDVDGNGRTDILVGTSDGRIILYMNYLGLTTGWQSYLVDSRGCPINDIGLGKLQNA